MRKPVLTLCAGLCMVMQLSAAAPSLARPERAEPPTGISPYTNPQFKCGKVLRFKFDQGPELPPPERDPLCVDYDKRDITLDNGGAVTFLSLEPARFAAAAGKCRYWQRDHWSIQISRPGEPVLVQWDGSYWFDLIRGEGAGILRRFRVAGHPSDAATVASLVERVSPALGAMIRAYGAQGGGGGATGHVGNPSGRCR
ncbi:MAG: hypothetical protein LC722_08495 [Actinobacteria bacterium]|nr:hypothetical protein [Actinomycetota bacterium]